MAHSVYSKIYRMKEFKSFFNYEYLRGLGTFVLICTLLMSGLHRWLELYKTCFP